LELLLTLGALMVFYTFLYYNNTTILISCKETLYKLDINSNENETQVQRGLIASLSC
jgi:hypothetical protein